MDKEPVAIINAVTAFIEATVLAIVAFGLDLTTEQVGAIMAVVLAGGVVAQTVFARARVFSPVTVEEVVANVAAAQASGELGE